MEKHADNNAIRTFVKNYRLIYIIALFIAISSGCASLHTKENSESFFFIQLSDPQLGFYPDSIEKEIRLYEKAVKEVNRLKPAFVVITGDFVHNQNDEYQLSEFKRITSIINPKIPVYYTPGNHDVGGEPTQQDLDFYTSIYGDDKFSFSYKNSRFIGINSNLIKASTPLLEDAQFDWLKKELTKGEKDNHIILFTHHPFFISKPDEPEAYFNIGVESRKRYFDLFETNGVTAVFAGHYHQNGYGKHGTIEMVTTSAVGEPLGDDPSGFRIVIVNKNDITHQYYDLDSIPKRIF